MTIDALAIFDSTNVWAMHPDALQALAARCVRLAPDYKPEDGNRRPGAASATGGGTTAEGAGDAPIAWIVGEATGVYKVRSEGAVVVVLGKHSAAHNIFGAGKSDAFTREGDAIVLSIAGPIMRRRSMFFSFFGIPHVAMDELATEFTAAVEDEASKEIIFRINSPGGEAQGMADLNDLLRAGRDRKPVRAFIEQMGASAAFGIAAQADTITAERDAFVGSIGVFSAVIDASKMFEQMGIKIHVLRSAPLKAPGAFNVDVTEGQLAVLQQIVDDLATEFVAQVAAGRRISVEKARELADGAHFVGDRALSLGMIDAVGTFQDFLAGGHEDDEPDDEDDDRRSAAAKETPMKAATIQELKAEFPGEDAFILAQLEGKATMADAQGSFNKILRERNAKLGEQNAALNAKAVETAKAAATAAAATPPAATPPPPAAAHGEPPMEFSGAAAAGSAPDFVGMALEKANVGDSTAMGAANAIFNGGKRGLVKAMKDTDIAEPTAHDAWKGRNRQAHGRPVKTNS